VGLPSPGFEHSLLSTTPAAGASPLLILGGELLRTPLLIQEGWRCTRRGGYRLVIYSMGEVTNAHGAGFAQLKV
jgi:hypothetical protein